MSENTCSNSGCSHKLSTTQTCPGTIRVGPVNKKNGEFVRPPNIRKPRVPVETKQTCNVLGAVYTEYQPEMISMDLLRAQNMFCGEPLVKLQTTKVLLN